MEAVTLDLGGRAHTQLGIFHFLKTQSHPGGSIAQTEHSLRETEQRVTHLKTITKHAERNNAQALSSTPLGSETADNPTYL